MRCLRAALSTRTWGSLGGGPRSQGSSKDAAFDADDAWQVPAAAHAPPSPPHPSRRPSLPDAVPPLTLPAEQFEAAFKLIVASQEWPAAEEAPSEEELAEEEPPAG